jgi:hypothetical protein
VLHLDTLNQPEPEQRPDVAVVHVLSPVFRCPVWFTLNSGTADRTSRLRSYLSAWPLRRVAIGLDVVLLKLIKIQKVGSGVLLLRIGSELLTERAYRRSIYFSGMATFDRRCGRAFLFRVTASRIFSRTHSPPSSFLDALYDI